MPSRDPLPPMAVPRMRGSGYLFAGVWLLILVQTVEDAWGNPDRRLGTLSIVATVGFGVLYFLLLSRGWGRMRVAGRLEVAHREAVLGLVALSLLTVLMVPGAGTSGFNSVFFICAYAAFALPFRQAVVVAVALILAVALLGRLVPGWDGLEGTAIGPSSPRRRRSGRPGSSPAGTSSRWPSRTWPGSPSPRSAAASPGTCTTCSGTPSRSSRSRPSSPVVSWTRPRPRPRRGGRRGAVARTALSDVRAALEGFRDVSLGTELAGARQALAAAGITAHLPRSVDEVDPELQELFGWVVREGVTNVCGTPAPAPAGCTSSPARSSSPTTGRDPGRGSGARGSPGCRPARRPSAGRHGGAFQHGGFELAVRV